MLIIHSVLKKLKKVEHTSSHPALKEAIAELEQVQKTSILVVPVDLDILREAQLEVAKQLLQEAIDSMPPGVHNPHQSTKYTDAVRYWSKVRNISLKEAACAIANLYSTLT